jgi:hypothetical protein
LWVDPPESIPTFASTETLNAYSTRVGLSVSGTYPGRYDFDVVESWLANPDAMAIDHAQLLHAWGLFDTLAASVGAVQPTSALNQIIWQHLWVGIYGAPNVAPEWPVFELDYLREHLGWGLDLFRARTYPAE